MRIRSIFLFLLILNFSFFQSCEKENLQQHKKEEQINLSIDSLFAQSKNTKYNSKIRLEKANSAIDLAEKTNIDSVKFNALINKTNLLTELEKSDDIIKSNHDIINWASTLTDKTYLAKTYLSFGKYFYGEYQTDSAYYYYNESKQEFLKLKNKDGIAKSNMSIAMILNDVASYFESEKYSLEALKYVKDDPNHPYLTPIYNNLAVSSGSTLNYNEELYWYDKALKLTDNPYYAASIKHNQAVANTLLENYDQAINILTNLKNDSILEEYPNLKGRVIDNLGYAIWLKNKNENAINYYNEAAEIFTENEDYFGLSTTLDHLIEYYKTTNPEKALDYANEKYRITHLSNNTEGRVNALKNILILKPSKAKIEEFLKLSDSVQFVNNNSKYKFAKLEYDVDANRQKVTTLSLENAKKELDLERSKISTIIISSCLIIGIICFVFYFYYIKQKRKQELLKTVYETEVTLSQKLHDELANDLFSTMSLVNTMDFENNQVKDKLTHNLNHIYSQTRRISRENNTINLTNFKAELDSMLGSYKSDQVNILSKGIDQIAWEKIETQVKYAIYRVLMELMTNMKKHSNCSLVVIKFEKNGKNLIINYIDNGVVENNNPKQKKNGIVNMENRIKGINGTINFDTTTGYKVTLNIPI